MYFSRGQSTSLEYLPFPFFPFIDKTNKVEIESTLSKINEDEEDKLDQ
jgi:hypothetical protein